jgi:endonuclease/exonuclease/phosphatase family metal-dependent hydrolase
MAITYVSWNIKQLGESKMQDNSNVFGVQSTVEIANYIKNMNADIVMVMEVTLREFGTDAVKLIGQNLGGSYKVGATSNDADKKPDRYAFFWNEKTIFLKSVGYPDFVDSDGDVVSFPNRYPALLEFVSLDTKTQFGVVILHGPEPAEKTGGGALQAMADLASLAFVAKPPLPLIISGDFNVDYNLNSSPYEVFENLKYSVLFKGNKTSLKMKFNTQQDWGTYLKSAYDNIFLSSALKATSSGVYDFVQLKGTLSNLPPYPDGDEDQQDEWQTILKTTRDRVSDHLPVWVTLNL